MMSVGDDRRDTFWPEARINAPIDAARPTQTVETSDLMYRMVSNTAIPAPKCQAQQYEKHASLAVWKSVTHSTLTGVIKSMTS